MYLAGGKYKTHLHSAWMRLRCEHRVLSQTNRRTFTIVIEPKRPIKGRWCHRPGPSLWSLKVTFTASLDCATKRACCAPWRVDMPLLKPCVHRAQTLHRQDTFPLAVYVVFSLSLSNAPCKDVFLSAVSMCAGLRLIKRHVQNKHGQKKSLVKD